MLEHAIQISITFSLDWRDLDTFTFQATDWCKEYNHPSDKVFLISWVILLGICWCEFAFRFINHCFLHISAGIAFLVLSIILLTLLIIGVILILLYSNGRSVTLHITSSCFISWDRMGWYPFKNLYIDQRFRFVLHPHYNVSDWEDLSHMTYLHLLMMMLSWRWGEDWRWEEIS